MKKLVIFASGNGSNAQCVIDYFNKKKSAQTSLILSNNPKAVVLQRAKKANIPAFSFNRAAFYHSNQILNLLKTTNPDLIILAGFLWLFPKNIIDLFPKKIINIHPALLPDFSGKGMYGIHVHKAVCTFAKAHTAPVFSGISVHYVTPEYDEGTIIFQEKVKVALDETPESLAKKVQALEHKHLPKVIEELLNS